MKIDLAKHFPIPPGGLNYPDCIVNGDMDLTAGFFLTLPQVFTMDDDGYLKLHNYLVQVIKRQPIGTTFHFQDFRFKQRFEKGYTGDSKVQRENFKRFYDREVLRGYTHMYVTYSNRQLNKINALDSRFLRGLQYTFQNPFKDAAKVAEQFKKHLNPIQSDLNLSERIRADRMSTEELRASLGNYFGLRYANPLSPEESKNFTIPDYEINDGYLRVGSQFVAVVSLTQEGPKLKSSGVSKHLPREATGVMTPQMTKLPTSLIYPLTLGLPFDHILNVGIEVLDNEAAKSIVGGLNGVGTNILAGFMEEAKQKQAETKGFIKTITEFHYQACRVSVNVVINDHSLSNLHEKVNFAITSFSNMNESKVLYENMESANLFFSSSPGYMRANNRTFLETVDQAVSYIPKEGLYTSDPHGIIMSSPFGEPTTVNFYDAPDLDNRNGVLFGPSGTGKSVLLNYLIDQFIASRCSVFTVDVGASYLRNCRINKGLYLDSKDAKNFSFNPFLCKQDSSGKFLFEPDDDEMLIKNYVVNHVYSNLAAIFKRKLLAEEKGIIKKSIRAFYQAVNNRSLFPDLTNYFEFTKEYESSILEPEYKKFIDFNQLRLLMEPFAIGEYKNILNGKRNDYEVSNRYTVAELKSVVDDDDLREIVFLNVLNNIAKIVEKKDFYYFFAILDEVVDYLKGDFGDSIGGFFRKIRKDGGGVIVATQGIDYLDKIDPLVKASILSNCDIKLLTSHSKYRNLYPALRRDLSLTDIDFQLLDSLEKDSGSREVFIKFGSVPRKYRVELSPYAYALYNTNKTDMDKIYAMEKEYGSMNAAIAQFLETKFKAA